MAVTAYAPGQALAAGSTVAFASQPSVAPSSAAAGQTFTATPGSVSNGSITSREWRQGAGVLSTGLTFPSTIAGAGTYQEFAGSVASNLIAFTVTGASAFFGSASPLWGDNTAPAFGRTS